MIAGHLQCSGTKYVADVMRLVREVRQYGRCVEHIVGLGERSVVTI